MIVKNKEIESIIAKTSPIIFEEFVIEADKFVEFFEKENEHFRLNRLTKMKIQEKMLNIFKETTQGAFFEKSQFDDMSENIFNMINVQIKRKDKKIAY